MTKLLLFSPFPHLVLDDVNEVYDPAPLLRVGEVEHVLLVAAVRGVVSLDLQGEPFFSNEKGQCFSECGKSIHGYR